MDLADHALQPVDPTELGPRVLPVPTSISHQARAALAPNPLASTGLTIPPAEDRAAWEALISMSDAGVLAQLEPRTAGARMTVETSTIGEVVTHEVTPEAIHPGLENCLVLDIHGGGLLIGAGEVCITMATLTALRTGSRVVSVDYRMPPAHPYPAALDDCLAAYRGVIRSVDPRNVVVLGASAGGNLAAALALRARDEGVPLPAALVLLTPEVDLTESGDTFQTLLGIDNVLVQSLLPYSELYANGHDLAHPYLSPLFGDFSKGFPRTFLQSGTRDLFLSNTVRMHRALRRADVPTELHVFEAMPHGGFQGSPEDAELDAEIRRFLVDALQDG